MAPPEKGPGGSSSAAGRADLQAVFHWIFRWVEISKLLPYLIHPSWFLNIPCPDHGQLPFCITSSSSSPPPLFPITPLCHHLLFSISAASSFPSAHCSCNSSRLCPQLSDCLPCALGHGICPHPRLSHCLCWRLQTFVSSPGLSLGPPLPIHHRLHVFCGSPGGSHSLPTQVPSLPANPPRKSSPPLGPPSIILYHPSPLTPPGAYPETGQCPAALALPWSILWGQPWTRLLGMLNPPRPHLELMAGDPGLEAAAT